MRFGMRNESVRLLMIVSLVHGAFLMWGYYAWQPHFLELLGEDAVWVTGIVAALIALATMAGNALVDYFSNFCGKRTTLLLTSSAILAVATIGVGAVDSFLPAVALFLVAMGSTGVGMPVQQAHLHAVVPSSERATVVSLGSLVGSAGGIGGSVGFGYLSRARSVAAGYVTAGFTLVLALFPLLALRRRREPADVIIGRRAGIESPCAGQGLPAVSFLDTTARQTER
jgi:MFS family permease